MKVIECGHSEEEPKWQICQHLLDRVDKVYDLENSHYRRFSGKGSDYVLLCTECSAVPDQEAVPLCWVCGCCFQDIAVGGKRLGVQGSPEIRKRDAGLRLEHTRGRFAESPGKLLAIAVSYETNGQWLALNDRRELIAFNTQADDFRRLLKLDEIDLQNAHDYPLTLLASPTGNFVLIASTYGSHGVVVDLRTAKTTMHLDRRDYHVEHCRFPVAFVESDGRTLLVHATDWNRLDISDPSNGKLLTARGPTSYSTGEKRPEHFLDYFQCGLSVSPDGEWIVGNGWIWHPVGAIVTWNLKRWLNTNVWESEDGESKRGLCWRDYYWDGPLCWVGNRTLAVWGHGDDAALIVPGIRLFNVETGEEQAGFAGPEIGTPPPGPVVSNGKSMDISLGSGTLLFDEFLFSYGHGCEFAVWDVVTGEQLFRDENFSPLGYDRRSKTFLSQGLDGSIRFSKFVKDQSELALHKVE